MTWARLVRFLGDESGPTAAEYAVMLGLIIGVVITAVSAVGNSTNGIWANDTNRISSALAS
jgi:pilus assembly protein Flp/PilA